ncbi:MAG: lipocalin family protein [Gemmatimonadaceae bacterium]
MHKTLMVALTAASLALVGCGKDATDPTSASVAGTYTLRTVNGSPLPYVTSQDETYTAEIVSSVLTLREDFSYAWAFTGRSTDNGQTTTNSESFPGTYRISGHTITLTDAEGSIPGTLSGNTITISIVALPVVMVLVFQR